MWAPEVHYLGGLWYIYYTAGTSADLNGQRLHVLKGSCSANPITSQNNHLLILNLIGGASPWDTYTYAAQLTTEWAIDASVIRFASYGNFLMYSCFHGVSHQSICIQALGSNFVSLTGSIYVISQPTQSFETQGNPVNEGPTALYFGGKTYIVYSASDCWTQYYCLGQLTWNGSSNPTSASAWSKRNGCVFSSANGNYGSGHNSFFQSPDASQTWIVYHATSKSSGACDDSRYTMVQLLGAHSDGSPNYGSPVDFAHAYSEPSA